MRGRRRALLLLLWALLVVACGLASAGHLTGDVLPDDDAFITFRYADRLASGRGFDYNPGERVFGSSSPLYTLWLAGLRLLTSSSGLPALAVRTNALFFVACALALAALVRRISGSAAAGLATGALFALHPGMLDLSTAGMETFLFAGLAILSLLAAATGRFVAAGALAGLSVLARPEGVLVALVVAGAWALSGARRPLGVLAALLAPPAVWALFATIHFGSPVPHSIVAKLAPVYPLPPGFALVTIVRWLGRWSAPWLIAEPAPARDLLALALAAAAVAGLTLSPARRARGGGMLAALFVLIVLFYALSNPLLFDWYTGLLFALWLAALACGLPGLLETRERAGEDHTAAPRPARTAVTAAVTLLLAAALLAPLARELRGEPAPFETARRAARLRTVGYREAARWLSAATPPTATVATPETGAFGYYWHGRVIDACGLVSPEALPFLPVSPGERLDAATGAIPVGLVREAQPEYVATLRVFAEKSLLASDWFARSYRLLRRVPLPEPVWGSDAVLLYQRADLPPPAPGLEMP